MWISGLILGLLAAIVSIVAAIKPFKPYKTRKQAVLWAWGFLIFAFVSGAQTGSTPVAQAPAVPQAAVQPAPMPPEEEKQRRAFCEYRHAGSALAGQYQSPEAQEASLEPLRRRYFDGRGLAYDAVMQRAIGDTWDFECFQGRVVQARSPAGTTYATSTGVTSGYGVPPSVKKVIKALEDDYAERKSRGVSCEGEEVSGVQYVLCEPTALFMVSANNGPPFLTPLNGKAQTHLEGVRMLRGPDGAGVAVQSLDEAGYRRWYVQDAMPISEVLKKF